MFATSRSKKHGKRVRAGSSGSGSLNPKKKDQSGQTIERGEARRAAGIIYGIQIPDRLATGWHGSPGFPSGFMAFSLFFFSFGKIWGCARCYYGGYLSAHLLKLEGEGGIPGICDQMRDASHMLGCMSSPISQPCNILGWPCFVMDPRESEEGGAESVVSSSFFSELPTPVPNPNLVPLPSTWNAWNSACCSVLRQALHTQPHTCTPWGEKDKIVQGMIPARSEHTLRRTRQTGRLLPGAMVVTLNLKAGQMAAKVSWAGRGLSDEFSIPPLCSSPQV